MKQLEILDPPEDLSLITPGCYEMSNRDYHSCKHVLSSSGARQLLDAPGRFAYEREQGRESTKALEDGTLWHSWMLENSKDVEVVDAKNWLTKAAKEAKAEILAEGKIPALKSDIDTLGAARKVLFDTPGVAGLLDPFLGQAELSFFTVHEPTGLLIRTRPDWLLIEGGRVTIVDYKTTRDASLGGFTHSCYQFGYHIQAAWYQHTIAQYFGLDAGEVRFMFIAQEKEPPYLTGVYELGYRELVEGWNLAGQALEKFQKFEETGYPTTHTPLGTKIISFKPWQLKTLQKQEEIKGDGALWETV